MPEKISVEEEKKLISIKSYSDEIEKLNVSQYPSIEDEKVKLVLQLKTLLVPLGKHMQALIKLEDEINQSISHPEMDDLYALDPVTQLSMLHIQRTKEYDLTKEQAFRAMGDFIINVIDLVNELAIKPKIKTEFLSQEEEPLKEEEITAIKGNAARRIIYWKQAVAAQKRRIEYQLYEETKTDRQKFAIVNDLFYEHTGEYVLERIKKEKEKKNDTP